MSRIPASLLYLTIYNPTLRLDEPPEDEDEDAEEQAHILFYTCKERAVSRDRMLRQVGLAKALVNFVQQFGGDDPCNSIHSQARRMIMVSPEPNFWIHACFDIAKVVRTPDPKGKSKTKVKADKGKTETLIQYEYEDWSIHDGAMRACILNAYERFKLTHGSFSSILLSLGQQALELQVERFWTVWAWSLDMEEDCEFGEAFGPKLHPHFSSLIHLVSGFNSNLSANTTAIILSRRHVIPSARYTQGRYPAALAHHLSSIIPPPSVNTCTANVLAGSVETIKGKGSEDFQTATSSSTQSKSTEPGKNTFLGTMDMRKWNWPEYLTFGKGNSTKPLSGTSTSFSESEKDEEKGLVPPIYIQEPSRVEVEVDANNLQDAIASDSISLASQGRHPAVHETKDFAFGHVNSPHNAMNGSASIKDSADKNLTQDQQSFSMRSTTSAHQGENLPPTPPTLPEFSLTSLHLAPWDRPTETKRVSIHYLIKRDYMLALLHDQVDKSLDTENADLEYAAGNVLKLFDDIESTIQDVDMKNATDSPPSAAKILRRDDQYLINACQYTLSSPGFTSNTGHLFNAKGILDADPGIHEVFSRGMNPQHWHIAKRGLGGTNSALEVTGFDEAVFMEVFRKETSLADVDNVLTGIVKKSGLVESPSGVRNG